MNYQNPPLPFNNQYRPNQGPPGGQIYPYSRIVEGTKRNTIRQYVIATAFLVGDGFSFTANAILSFINGFRTAGVVEIVFGVLFLVIGLGVGSQICGLSDRLDQPGGY